ncbi:histidine ammonia-lyase [Persicimonas caeni]|uniref:Histidine ammonia-lyase n=1 Tax=Persicimonas caeni TaxID=2292766 RepID=A0A4Y6PTS6_PERCE|nr:histidine ammonia-lyase [Persicimonas caeni]QDG51650.1 histidine ammonia-lyase [Persicimonas caeni]QED32871.1 histidine ammonia-lyase [Persicimonas caeni]
MHIGHTPLNLETIERVVFDHVTVEIAPSAHPKIEQAAQFVREMAQSGEAVYGVTTGFGANRDRVIRPEDAETLQERLLVSHACGVGQPLPTEVVRAMMLLRINALSQGNSGIRLSTLQLLADMLNAGVHPVIPELGSVGASGDLCPLAHMCLPLIGLGEAEFEGEKLSGEEAMMRAGLQPVRLTYKEGLALLNGTQAMTAAGVVAAIRFRQLLDCADTVGAMSLEAVAGRLAALDPRIHEIRGRKGQIDSARALRALLADSELAGAAPGTVEGKVEYVQDSYCLRCMPQVHGASRDVLDHVIDVLTTEANAVTDNPLVFPPEDGREGAILSGGNFHGQPVALALDYLKTAIAEIGSVSERRCAKLTDKYFSEGLPPFLVSNPGLNSGMMIPQYVAAALVSENKSQAFPASVDSIPTSANMEDHVSMGMHAALHTLRALTNVETIVGIEYLIAAQALDLRNGHRLGEGTRRAQTLLREHVEFMKHDRVLYPDIEKAATLVRDGSLAETVSDFFE